MKIEMGESLVRSWLRHCKNCQFAELNWKISKSWDKTESELFNKFQDHFQDNEIFKKTKDESQLLQQGEIDVLGIQVEKGNINQVFAVDIAFHENGLNYGSKEETCARIKKKILRSTCILDSYFNGIPATILFISPKIHNAQLNALKEIINEINTVFEKLGLIYKVELYANEDFKNEILLPLEAFAQHVADTSELFMRALQLYKLCSEFSENENINMHKHEKLNHKKIHHQ